MTNDSWAADIFFPRKFWFFFPDCVQAEVLGKIGQNIPSKYKYLAWLQVVPFVRYCPHQAKCIRLLQRYASWWEWDMSELLCSRLRSPSSTWDLQTRGHYADVWSRWLLLQVCTSYCRIFFRNRNFQGFAPKIIEILNFPHPALSYRPFWSIDSYLSILLTPQQVLYLLIRHFWCIQKARKGNSIATYWKGGKSKFLF